MAKTKSSVKSVKKTPVTVRKTPVAIKRVKAKSIKKTVTAEKPETVKAEIRTGGSLQAPLVDQTGKSVGKISIPKEIFGAKVDAKLIAQAVRVYLANQREGSASTKTRGEVEGSTRKIYRQKGTGRARHGGIRAPIFVGGGIAFGPRPHNFSMDMPKKMRRLALFGAFTSQYTAGNVIFVSGLNSLEPKTKKMSSALTAIGIEYPALILSGKDDSVIHRAARNIKSVMIEPAANANPYLVLTPKKIVITTAAIEILKNTFMKK
jgi:large subunit ribosomal protein L4